MNDAVADKALPPLVIVTGADSPTGLTTARALRHLPVRVWGVTNRPEAYCCASRLWNALLIVAGDADAQLDRLLRETAAEAQKPVLLFAQDDLVNAANRRQSELSARFHLPLPAVPDTERMLDKTCFHAWARERGFPIPHAAVADSPAGLSSALRQAPLPAIVKPWVRTPEWDARMGNRKCLWVSETGDLQTSDVGVDELFTLCPRFIVQSWIGGGDADVYFYLAAISDDGRILDEVCGRKYMQWPPLTGSTAVCGLIEDPRLLALSREILLAAGLRGLGSIEFKRDPADGRFYITEPTVGRNDHQSAVAMAGGFNPTGALVGHILGLEPDRGTGRRVPSPLWIDELSTFRYCRSESAWWRLARLLVAGVRHGLPRPLLWARGDGRPCRRMVGDVLRRWVHR